MVIKYTKIFHSKTLQNILKLGFLVWKQTIWQPCFSVGEKVVFVLLLFAVCSSGKVGSQWTWARPDLPSGSSGVQHGAMKFLTARVARWYFFKPKIPLWINFGWHWNRKWWYILWPIVIFYCLLVYVMAIG
jgi:hypothetical protein